VNSSAGPAVPMFLLDCLFDQAGLARGRRSRSSPGGGRGGPDPHARSHAAVAGHGSGAACGRRSLWERLSAASVIERRTEIGLMKALGAGSGTVGFLLAAEQLLLAFVGGGTGYALGIILARLLGERIFWRGA